MQFFDTSYKHRISVVYNVDSAHRYSTFPALTLVFPTPLSIRRPTTAPLAIHRHPSTHRTSDIRRLSSESVDFHRIPSISIVGHRWRVAREGRRGTALILCPDPASIQRIPTSPALPSHRYYIVLPCIRWYYPAILR